MMVRWSGEHQVNLNLSLTLLDVKLVVESFLDEDKGDKGSPAVVTEDLLLWDWMK